MNKFIYGIILFLALLFPLYQLWVLNSTEITAFHIDEISMNKNLLFVVDGSVIVQNPSLLAVTVRQVSYTGFIAGEQVFTGELPGQTIPAQGNATFFFSQEIDWVPDTETALAILDGEDVTVTIHLEPQAAYLYFFTLHSEEEITFSLTDLIAPYIREQIATLSSLFF